jgi:hypothetical protein
VLEAGQASDELGFASTPEVVANQILATIEGGMLLARMKNHRPATFRALSDALIASLRRGVS